MGVFGVSLSLKVGEHQCPSSHIVAEGTKIFLLFYSVSQWIRWCPPTFARITSLSCFKFKFNLIWIPILEKGMANHFSIFALRTPWTVWKGKKTLKDEIPRLVGAKYATGEEWRNNSRKNEEMEPKQKQCPVVNVTGDGSNVWCYKEYYCIGTWNVRSMNQGKLEMVKQEMERVNIDILGISELRWAGMGKFGILQARILEWVAFTFSRGSSQSRDWTQVSHIAGRFFTSWATREAQEYWSG